MDSAFIQSVMVVFCVLDFAVVLQVLFVAFCDFSDVYF